MKRIEKKLGLRWLRLLLIGLVLPVGLCACGKLQEMDWEQGKKMILFRNTRTVGTDITEKDFQEFYYTNSATVNPPKFQRYRFYEEEGKHFFYHEKREGNHVFLTEEDITVHGTMELSAEEWQTFWDYMKQGTVRRRSQESLAGEKGTWLYLYWEGDPSDYQVFQFDEAEMVLSFEGFCEELKQKALAESGETPTGQGTEEIHEGAPGGALMEPAPPERTNVVQVDNTLDFLMAIAPDTQIVMEEGTYNLTQDIQAVEGESAIRWETIHDYVTMSLLTEGFEAWIYGVSGLSIVAVPGADVRIVTDPRKAKVLNFMDCSDLYMDGITVGHTDGASCEGSVIHFENCSDISLRQMDLYGCGTYGITYSEMENLVMTGSVIRECSSGFIFGEKGQNLVFSECVFRNCKGLYLIGVRETVASFLQCSFEGNEVKKGLFYEQEESDALLFDGCTFGEAEAISAFELEYSGTVFTGCSPEELNPN